MGKLDLKLVRNRETFVNKKKNTGTASNYNSAINNFDLSDVNHFVDRCKAK